MKHDNPASRFLAVIEKGQTFPKTDNCLATWRALLGPGCSDVVVVARLGKFMVLMEEVVGLLQKYYPDHRDMVAYWTSQVNSAFMTQNLQGQWATFMDRVDGHAVNYIRSSASLLQSKIDSQLISDEQLAELRSGLEALINRVLELKIDSELKRYVLLYLHRIISSIDEYKITGAAGILQSMEAMIGHASFDVSYKDFFRDHEVGKAICNWIATAANLVTVAVALPQLELYGRLLTGG